MGLGWWGLSDLRSPVPGEVSWRGGGEDDGRGVGQGVRGQHPHYHCHVGHHVMLAPQLVTHTELELVPGGATYTRRYQTGLTQTILTYRQGQRIDRLNVQTGSTYRQGQRIDKLHYPDNPVWRD